MNIYEKIEEYLKNNDNVNVIIAGCTCSGKTTLSDNISKKFSKDYKVSIFEQDVYFKNLEDIPKTRFGYLTDSIYAFHTDEFREDVQEFLTCGKALIPRYHVATNTRYAKDNLIEKGNINIFEGLHTISLLYSVEKSIKVFVNTDIDVCLKRRIERDTTLYKIPEERIREYFRDCILPMYKQFIVTQKDFADIII